MISKRQKELEELLNDNFSGSSELLDKLNDWFLKYYADDLPDQSILDRLHDNFQVFETITNYLGNIKEIIDSNTSNSLNNFCISYRDSKRNVSDQLFTNVISVIGSYNNFVTISNSGQVYHTLMRYSKQNKNLEVTVCESRPNFEGRILAGRFADQGIKTNLITEAMMAEFVKCCDCVITGADKILADGTVINKVGSRMLAITAAYYDKPFVILADKSKVSKDNTYKIDRYARIEICDCPNNIKVSNYYFETIDTILLAKVVTN